MVRMFLVTANVGSVFDNLEHGLPVWLNEFSSAVRSRDPEFVAIHFQETGGKSCEDASDAIKEFFRQLVDRMERLNLRVVEGFVDSSSNIEDQFTALSSIYFVHESLRLPVHIWDFQDGRFHEVSRSLTPSSTTLHPNVHMGPSLNETGRKQKEKFPKNFYPNCKWSRKGFLRTRWRFGRTTLDLVNIHLFHDSCNLMAASVFPSPFAQHREKTLKYTLDRILSDGLEKSPLFIFGDFNFRINAYGVMEILKKDFGDPVSKLCEENSLVINTKKFQCPEQELRFKNSYEWLKRYDFEFKTFPSPLVEHDLNFHPTYPFSEELDEPGKFMRTRIPAWCDRVLFTPSTRDIFVNDFPIDYNLIGSNVCMGDHKPVGLSLKIQTNEHPPTLNSTTPNNKGDTGIILANDATTTTIVKGKPVPTMTELILDLSESPTSSGTLAKLRAANAAATASSATIVDDENSIFTISPVSHTLKNGSNCNIAGLLNDNNGNGLSKSVCTSSNEIINISSLPKDRVYNEYNKFGGDSIESEFESPTSADASNCFFGALLRCRGKVRLAQQQGTVRGCNNKNGSGGGGHNNSNAFIGFKALSKYKRGGGGSCSRSGSLLEPIAGAGCEFPCSSLPSSGMSSQRPSVTGTSISAAMQSDSYLVNDDARTNALNQRGNKKSNCFGNFFTAPNGKIKSSEGCHRNKCSQCCCCNGFSISPSLEETALQPPPHNAVISTDCRCQNRLMLNLATMITNTSINNSSNNSRTTTNNGELPLGSSNLSLIAINSSTDPDKQTFVDSSGKIIEDCCNENNKGKIPMCWTTTTTTTTAYNNGNNKMILCANCNNVKNLQNNLSSHHHNNSNSTKGQSNGLPFNFRNRSASQGSASLQAKCKCHFKENMSRRKDGCVSCSKCVIL